MEDLTIKEKLLNGVNTLVDNVKVTLGAKGKTVLFKDRLTQRPRITKDGVTVAKQVFSKDQIEHMAIEIVREAAEKTVRTSMDGTTSTCILAQYLINEGFKILAKGKSFYELSKEMDEQLVKVIENIKSKSLAIESNMDRLLDVATVSSNNKEIGRFIFDIISEIGIYGHIEVKNSNNVKDKIDKVKGIKYHKGFYAPQFVSDLKKMQWKFSNVYIVLFNDTIRSMEDLEPYFQTINGDGSGKLVKTHPILFVVNDVEPVVLQTLINNRLMYPTQFNVMFTEHDGFGNRKIEIMNDIAALTSASESNAEEPGQIGFAQEVIVDEDTTSILGGLAEVKIVNELVELTKDKLNDPDIDESDKLYYKRRLATLAGGVAVIHVGAPTEVEMKEKKDRIDDAVGAVLSSIERGVSVGGCYTFIKCQKELSKEPGLKEGHRLVNDALFAPFKQLCINADIEKEIKTIQDRILAGYGYDLISNEFYRLDSYNVYDPTGVLIDALSNAVSVAKSILSIEKAIAE